MLIKEVKRERLFLMKQEGRLRPGLYGMVKV